jgi:hypothetical protein
VWFLEAGKGEPENCTCTSSGLKEQKKKSHNQPDFISRTQISIANVRVMAYLEHCLFNY